MLSGAVITSNSQLPEFPCSSRDPAALHRFCRINPAPRHERQDRHEPAPCTYRFGRFIAPFLQHGWHVHMSPFLFSLGLYFPLPSAGPLPLC